MQHVNNLLDSVSSLRLQSNETTIFEMIGKANSETVFSAFLGNLINPSFHEGGQKCLISFLELLSPEGEVCCDANNLKVIETEYDFGKKGCDVRPTGGRADIYIEDGNNNVIVIENKIEAPDQDYQLLRYHNSLIDNNKPNHILVYLTLDGKSPSPKSLGENEKDIIPLSRDLVINLSYEEVDQWLTKIIKDKSCSDTIAQHVIQFQYNLKRMIKNQDTINKILSSGEYYEAALIVAKELENARMQLQFKFLEDLKKRIPDYNPGDIKVSDDNTTIVLLPIYKDGIEATIEIDWRLYVRSQDTRLNLNNGTWEYVGQKNDYNFHDCSKKVKDYLSESTKEKVIADVIQQITKILDRAK